jgi:hypothetical protein
MKKCGGRFETRPHIGWPIAIRHWKGSQMIGPLAPILIEDQSNENKRHHLLAFKDFCLDLFEEEFGRIPPEEEIDPRFVKGLLIRK